MDRLLKSLENRGSLFWTIVSVILVGLLGIVDYLTGYEISFSLFYLAPVALATSYVSFGLGLMISILSAVTWLIAEIAAGKEYTQAIIYIWNTLIRFGFFIIVTYLISELRKVHEAQRILARTDYVSGAMNARSFNELVEMEIGRSRRYEHPFTVAYIDLDNFKAVNDNLGHDVGDEAIRFVASELKTHLRGTDIVARLGGDEFALLLIATGQPEAQLIITRLHARLIERMQRKNWPVTLSIGVVICGIAPPSAEKLMKMADELMYTVKNTTKNDVRFATYMGSQSGKC